MADRILVTGGAGFIGSAVCLQLLEHGDAHVLNLDKLTYASNLTSLDPIRDDARYKFVRGDICDDQLVADVIARFDPDVILHLAAETHVDRSIETSSSFIRTNILGTHALLEAALRHYEAASPAKKARFRFVMVSTDEVYGSLNEGEGGFDEQSRYDPRSPYSASKASSDHLARAWFNTYGLPVVVTNCSNNYGPRQNPEKLIPRMVLRGLHGEPLPVYGDGKNVRDWLHVDDHARALITLTREGKPGETYCIGGDCEMANIDLVRMICAELDRVKPDTQIGDREKLIQFVADRPGHDFRYSIDFSKIRTDHGWRPSADFQQGLRETIAWYLSNQDWWSSKREGGVDSFTVVGRSAAAGE